jgi:hypothetical protein
MAFTVVPAVVDGDDLTDDFTLAVKAFADEVAGADPLTVTTWTPTLTNIAIGTGGSALLAANYMYSGGLLGLRCVAVLGTSGASVTGAPTFSLPPGFTAANVSTTPWQGQAVIIAAGASYLGGWVVASTTTIQTQVLNVSGTYATRGAISATVPGTFTAGDQIHCYGTIMGSF